MGIGIHRHADLTVPQELLDNLGVDAHRQEDGRSAVPEIVEAHVGEASIPEQFAEHAEDIGGIKKVARGIAEHQIALLPCGTGFQPHF